MDKRKVDYLSNVPEKHKELFTRIYTGGQRSFTQAIKAKCLDCVGFEDAFNRIGQCKIIICPLHNYRPYQDRADEESDSEALPAE